MNSGPHSAQQGISRREYSRRRGVDEKAIRKHIESGVLAAAVRPDGKIDPDVADALLAACKTGGASVPSGLVKARTRKLAAGVALLQDELAEIEATALPAIGVAAVTKDIFLQMARVVWPIATMASRLAGLTPAAAMAALDDEVRDRLEAVASTKIQAPRGRKAQDGPALADMTPVDLATLRSDLQARKMEVDRDLRTGHRVHLADATKGAVDAVLRMRAKLLALPSKIGATFSDVVVDMIEIEALLQAEVAEALAELAGPAVTLAEIESARDQAIAMLPRRLTFTFPRIPT
jgi:hypothetical protein